MEAAPGFEPGIKDLQSSALPLGYAAPGPCTEEMERKTGLEPATPTLARLCSTTELLPLLSKRWWRDPELNWGHADFQSAALPTELSRPDRRTTRGKMAGLTRLELATSGVTGRHSNQLSYNPAWPQPLLSCGGRNWVRTNDPLLVRQVLFR